MAPVRAPLKNLRYGQLEAKAQAGQGGCLGTALGKDLRRAQQRELLQDKKCGSGIKRQKQALPDVCMYTILCP